MFFKNVGSKGRDILVSMFGYVIRRVQVVKHPFFGGDRAKASGGGVGEPLWRHKSACGDILCGGIKRFCGGIKWLCGGINCFCGDIKWRVSGDIKSLCRN